MKKKIGSKLASSVRQAKSKSSQDAGVSVTKDASTTPVDVVIQTQLAPSSFSSKRVWPD